MTNESQAILNVIDADKSYGRRRVLSAASLRVAPGEVRVLFGRNGSGKSTLLKLAAGRIQPDSGTVTLFGQSTSSAGFSSLAARGLFYLPEHGLFSPAFTVRQQLAMMREQFGGGDVQELAEKLRLTARLDQRPHELSRGELRRAEFACVMVRRPLCLLADEPLRGVSPLDAEILVSVLRSLASTGCAAVITGHELPMLTEAADQMTWCVDGTTRELGTPADISRCERFRHEYFNVSWQRSSQDAAIASPPPVEAGVSLPADSISLVELGLVPDPSGTWPLAWWLDTTHSVSGHQALKEVIATPLGSIEQIHARQSLLLHLAGVGKDLPWSELQSLVDQVERYLGSNYLIVPQSLTARAQFTLRFREIVADVETYLRAVDALLTLCGQLYTRIYTDSVDEGFRALLAAIGRVVNHPLRQPLHLAVERKRGLSAMDGSIRGADDHTGTLSGGSMRVALRSLAAALSQLDAFCSLAHASAALEGTLPTMVPRGSAELAFEGLRHPLLPGGATNDVSMTNDERVLFLTGPNMAGKSTLLRAIGIAVHCAHLGMTINASGATIPLYDQLLVSFSARDSLRRGESLYLAEVRRVRKIVDAVKRGYAVLAICDEVFRGTNIKDATQATGLLVDGLSRARVGTFVIASHLADVAETRAQRAGVSCWCMEVEFTNDSPHFTHHVRRGISDVRLGMLLLDAEGVGPILRGMVAQ